MVLKEVKVNALLKLESKTKKLKFILGQCLC